MPRYASCPNCSITATDSGYPAFIFKCNDCGKMFCGYCANNKYNGKTFKCPKCNSWNTEKIGETNG